MERILTDNQFRSEIPSEPLMDEIMLISKWSIDSGSMLPLSIDRLNILFREKKSLLVYDDKGILLCHIAETFTLPDDWIEIGGIITNPQVRNHGVAKFATLEFIKKNQYKYLTKKIYALANEISAPLLESLGARKMKTTELPKDVWTYCKDCPRIPKQINGLPFICCDTPYDLTPLKQNS